ncbi:MAG: neutral zinc metallopeptidase [Pseudomonadota bacterium]|nr:neutral zinc metallopeptidase [Pseudomonadota bacterium]
MQWRGRRGSDNIEDRRGQAPRTGFGRSPFGSRRSPFPGGFGGGLGGGSGRRIALPRSRLGLLVMVAVLVIGALSQGGLLEDAGVAPGDVTGGAPRLSEAQREAGEFVSVVLADTEEVWADRFAAELGRDYVPPRLVLFTGAVRSACGGATSAAGPFYCPADQRAYLDTAFFDELSQRLGASGDFAAAYVIAHEIGHHVENLLGVLDRAQQAKAGASPDAANAIQVRVELQADCLAGVWAQRAQEKFGSLDPGDVDEALNAASRIGDDALQRQAGQVVRPETFQHGTSEQRRGWFQRGFEGGTIAACDTFATDRL